MENSLVEIVWVGSCRLIIMYTYQLVVMTKLTCIFDVKPGNNMDQMLDSTLTADVNENCNNSIEESSMIARSSRGNVILLKFI